MDMNVVLGTLLQLFSLILLGFFLNKINIIDSVANGKISTLIVNVTAPLLVFSSVKGSSIKDGGSETVWMILLGGTVFYLVMPMLAKLVVLPFRLPEKKSHVYQMFFIFTNLAFMGFPVSRSIYGDQGVFFMGILNMCFGIANFSYGVYLLQKGTPGVDRFRFKKLMNPGIFSSLGALAVYLSGLYVPDPIMDFCKLVGETTVPLSMMMIGASLAVVPLKKIFQFKSLYVMALICMIAEPWFVYTATGLFIQDEMAVGILTLATAMPAASMIAMLCNRYKVEEDIAAVGVFVTTLLSMVTIPFIVSWLLV